MPLGDFYSRYPALGGYEAGRQMVIGDQQRELGDAQKMLTLASLLQQQQQRQQAMDLEKTTRQVLSQTGGDVGKAIKALLSSGNYAAAAKLDDLYKIEANTKRDDELRRVATELYGGGRSAAAPSPPSGNTLMPPAVAPAQPLSPQQVHENRIAHLNKLAIAYSHNPQAVTAIQREIDKLEANRVPKTRSYQSGENQVTEELQSDGTWKQIGIGPKFAKGASTTVVTPHPAQMFTDGRGRLWTKEYGAKTWTLAQGPEGPVSPAAPKPTPRDPRAEQLYRDYINHPQVKESMDADTRLVPITQYMIEMKKPGAVSRNVDDQALARAYLATIRGVGDRALVMDAKGLAALPDLGDRIGNMASAFFAGKDLTDETRTQMFNVLVNRRNALKQAADRHRKLIESRANAMKLPLDQVFGKPEEQ